MYCLLCLEVTLVLFTTLLKGLTGKIYSVLVAIHNNLLTWEINWQFYDQCFHLDSIKLRIPPIAMTGTDISPCGVVRNFLSLIQSLHCHHVFSFEKIEKEILDGSNSMAVLNVDVTFELEEKISIICHYPLICYQNLNPSNVLGTSVSTLNRRPPSVLEKTSISNTCHVTAL